MQHARSEPPKKAQQQAASQPQAAVYLWGWAAPTNLRASQAHHTGRQTVPSSPVRHGLRKQSAAAQFRLVQSQLPPPTAPHCPPPSKHTPPPRATRHTKKIDKRTGNDARPHELVAAPRGGCTRAPERHLQQRVLAAGGAQRSMQRAGQGACTQGRHARQRMCTAAQDSTSPQWRSAARRARASGVPGASSDVEEASSTKSRSANSSAAGSSRTSQGCGCMPAPAPARAVCRPIR